jgi:hypothetical protein
MEVAVEKLAVICFFLFGISHIVQPRAWAEFFIRLREKGTAGSFINGWIHFPLGALIVAFHNVWHGIPAILTVMGYAWVIKGFIYFVLPRHGLKMMQRVRVERFLLAARLLPAVEILPVEEEGESGFGLELVGRDLRKPLEERRREIVMDVA